MWNFFYFFVSAFLQNLLILFPVLSPQISLDGDRFLHRLWKTKWESPWIGILHWGCRESQRKQHRHWGHSLADCFSWTWGILLSLSLRHSFLIFSPHDNNLFLHRVLSSNNYWALSTGLVSRKKMLLNLESKNYRSFSLSSTLPLSARQRRHEFVSNNKFKLSSQCPQESSRSRKFSHFKKILTSFWNSASTKTFTKTFTFFGCATKVYLLSHHTTENSR